MSASGDSHRLREHTVLTVFIKQINFLTFFDDALSGVNMELS